MTKTIPILGSRQIGPRQIGPLENVGAANWAPGILLGQGCKKLYSKVFNAQVQLYKYSINFLAVYIQYKCIHWGKYVS